MRDVLTVRMEGFPNRRLRKQKKYLVNGSYFRNNSEKPNGMDVKIPKSTARIRTATCEDSPY
jgi:hypothetical protein